LTTRPKQCKFIIVGDFVEQKKEDKNNNLAKIIEFFKDDTEIKKLMIEAAPKEEYEYRPEKYAKLLKETIEYIKYHICRMLNSFFQMGLKDAEEFFNHILNRLYSCGENYYKLQEFYTTYISNMRPVLVDEVGKNCIGYYLWSGVSLNKATSVNELLHIIHQTVTNDEYLYNRMPQIETKENESNKTITLYGEKTELADSIFQAIPSDLFVGKTDILSFMGQLLIMIRDRGHALSIEISKDEQDRYFVNYFIPKICNVEMVNMLKGVHPVDENSNYTNYTRGVFQTTESELPFELVDFISKVPTDMDMNDGSLKPL